MLSDYKILEDVNDGDSGNDSSVYHSAHNFHVDIDSGINVIACAYAGLSPDTNISVVTTNPPVAQRSNMYDRVFIIGGCLIALIFIVVLISRIYFH
jgi:hypothetical protein